MIASEILEGKLWAGPREAAQKPELGKLAKKGLACVVSIFPAGEFVFTFFKPVPIAHRSLVCWDNDMLLPAQIEYAVDLDMPTLIHCNAGKNRSTALAACWLIRHCDYNPDDALEKVIIARAKDLGVLPVVTNAMRRNVDRYWEWRGEFG